MSEETKTYVFDQGGSNWMAMLAPLLAQRGVDPSVLSLLNNNGMNGGGWFIWIIFIIFIVLFGGGNFGGRNGTEFLSSQISNSTGRELLQELISGNRSAINSLASTLGCDVNAINSALSAINSSICNVASQTGLSAVEVKNTVLSGNAEIARQISECCCDNKLLVTNQGYENRIAISDQTNALATQADRNTRSITDAISAQTVMINDKFCDLEKSRMQDKIDSYRSANETLNGKLDAISQTKSITDYFTALVAPLQKEVSEIRAAQPNTVSVPYPNLTAVSTTPTLYGGLYSNVYGGLYGGFPGGLYNYTQGSIWA